MNLSIRENVKKLNLWCGYTLTKDEQGVLTRLSIAEFDKPKQLRQPPFKLVEETKRIVKYSKKWLKE
jgi:hypothetical protein